MCLVTSPNDGQEGPLENCQHQYGHGTKPRSTCSKCQTVFQANILRWGANHCRTFPWRRPDRTSYELVVAELLLQQTRAEQTAKCFAAIIDRCPDWDALASVPLPELEELLKPLGLHRRRSAALHALAQAVLSRGLPIRADQLETLPGIGQYMARAIAAQVSNEVVAPIDTNVARVLERVFGPRKLADIRYDPGLQELALNLVPRSGPGEYLVALLDFSAVVCRPRAPRCHECPLTACGYRSRNISSLPTNASKPA